MPEETTQEKPSLWNQRARLENELDSLIKSPDIPVHIKKHFAYDCMERALIEYWMRTGEEPTQQWIDVLANGRRVVEGGTDQRILPRWPPPPPMPVTEKDWGGIMYHLQTTTRRARAVIATSTEDWQQRQQEEIQEYQWQIAHLKHLAKQHLQARWRLAFLISSHGLRYSIAPSFGRDLEEALFD